MRTSATGRSTSNPPAATGGFTLVEILVVVLIIGIMAGGALLSIGVVGQDRELDRERDRILAITGYLRDQAALQNREFGMRCYAGGYEFVAWDSRGARWERVADDPLLRSRALPGGIDSALVVEGRPVILPKADAEDIAPQIMLFSSGEVSSFELTLRRAGDGSTVVLAPSLDPDGIVARTTEATTS